MTTVKKAVKSFLRARKADGLSQRSLDWYRYALRPLARRFKGFKMAHLTPDLLRQYIQEQQGQRTRYRGAPQKPEQPGALSSETIRSRIRGYRAFFNWYWDEHGLLPSTNPMRRIKAPPRADPLPKATELADVVKMLEACDDTPLGLRNRAMIAFLADTGARASGMLKLTLINLDLVNGRALVREKGQRVRFVPLSEYGVWAMQCWLEARPVQADEIVFCALRRANYAEPLTISGLHYALETTARKASIEGKFNPHAFRHGFGKTLSLQGVPVTAVARLMGHSTTRTTADYYLRFNQAELDLLAQQAVPLKDVEHS